MKRKSKFFTILFLIMTLCGCGNGDTHENNNEVGNVEQWGIVLSIENVTPTGLTLVCTQEGGNPTGELQTGSWYILEVEMDGVWKEVQREPQEYEVGWTSEAWMISENSVTKWNVDWEWLYGELPVGKYRIGKSIDDFRGTGDYDTKVYYAEFEITDEIKVGKDTF